MQPDGCLIHKGRKDFRVKVRGYGVDLMEVENTLRSHPHVREAVVVVRPNESGEAHLVSYFTSSGKSGPSVSELRGFLKNTLTDYMIPSTFMRLDVMPMTANERSIAGRREQALFGRRQDGKYGRRK